MQKRARRHCAGTSDESALKQPDLQKGREDRGKGRRGEAGAPSGPGLGKLLLAFLITGLQSTLEFSNAKMPLRTHVQRLKRGN